MDVRAFFEVTHKHRTCIGGRVSCAVRRLCKLPDRVRLKWKCARVSKSPLRLTHALVTSNYLFLARYTRGRGKTQWKRQVSNISVVVNSRSVLTRSDIFSMCVWQCVRTQILQKIFSTLFSRSYIHMHDSPVFSVNLSLKIFQM